VKKTLFAILMSAAFANAQGRLEMPSYGAPLPTATFQLSNSIPKSKLALMPAKLAVFVKTGRPIAFPMALLVCSIPASDGLSVVSLPPLATAQLSQLGFHWNRRRQVWQHPCGQFRPGAWIDPRDKYPTFYPAD
jgi:hypothetical protein